MGKEKRIMENWKERLAGAALAARQYAYAPYSGFRVGAALLTTKGKIFTGCNVENASYGAANCAERTAFFKAVSEGERQFLAIAVAGGKEEEPEDYAYPCGICRQVMQEFCGADFMILTVRRELDWQEYSLGELFPHGFGGDGLR